MDKIVMFPVKKDNTIIKTAGDSIKIHEIFAFNSGPQPFLLCRPYGALVKKSNGKIIIAEIISP
jgi:hypothetical protein